MSVAISQSAHCLNNIFPDQSSYNSTSNISLASSCNMAGINPCFPTIAPAATLLGNYRLNNFNPLYQTTAHRTLQPSINPSQTFSNSWVITYAGNYKVTAYTSACQAYVNGVLTASTSTLRGVITLSSLSIGDIVTVTEPATLYHNTYGGLQGAYCGYAGYSFASRRDRNTPNFFIFNMSDYDSDYAIGYGSSDANLSSLTSVASGTISSKSYATYTPTTNGNYFIYNSQLSVVWRGEAPSKDCMTVYPLSNEVKYGWFSADGHVFGTNNGESNRTDSGGGDTITGRTTTDASANVISGLNTGQANCYGNDGVSATIKGGSYFSGIGCAVYNTNGNNANNEGTIYAAESQGDGNGSEMTAFTGIAAHARGALSGKGAAWVAAIGAGFSGSTPTYPLYADVIMRFNSSGVFQDAEDFTGQNTTNPNSKKAYWGNGSGTGTYFSAGDFFWSTVAVQGFHDTTATQKDETNMMMSNTITLPEETTHAIYGESAYNGFEDATISCEEEGVRFTVYSPSTVLALGSVLFLGTGISTYDTPFNGMRLFYRHAVGRDNYDIQVDYNGIIIYFSAC
jgi:hypothetical protein